MPTRKTKDEDEMPRKKRRIEDDEDETPRKKKRPSEEEEEDDEPRPKKKRRDDDEEDETPRSRRSRDDDDEEERPKKRRRDDDDEDEPKRELKGWAALDQRREEEKARQEQFENKPREFWLKDGESAVIQFLDDEPYTFDGHTVKNKQGKWVTLTCQMETGKHCLMCRKGLKKSFRAAAKIIDYRGTWDKEKSKFKHDKPVEKLWNMNGTLAEAVLAFKTKRKRELSELVIEVTRSGSGKKSTYNLEVALDEEDVKMAPRKFKEELESAKEACQPLSDKALEAIGFEGGYDD